jgi:hypothetical protein
MTSGLKAAAMYRRVCIDMFQVSFNASMDFMNASKPAQFGVSLSFGGM